MNQITDALMLRDNAPRGQVALLYAAIGLGAGAFFFSK